MDSIKLTSNPRKLVDRHGSPEGMFLYPYGTSIEERSLPPHSLHAPYSCYEVIRPFEVESGRIAPWFDQPGGGIQYYTGNTEVFNPKTGESITPTVRDLLRLGYLREMKVD